MSAPRVWFITGSSTGFGRLLTEFALEKGDKVVATLRKPEVISDLATKYAGKDQLLVLKVDVTKPEEITSAFQKTEDAFGRIDIVVNNAGYGIIAEVEGTPDADARHLFEVVFWGARTVSTEAIRFFREVNKPAGGKLLQVSSMFGVGTTPGAGYYCAAKFAFEGLSESLAKELHPDWNIQISLLCPGWYKTPMVTNNAVQITPHPAYASDPTLPSAMVREAFQTMVTGEHPALGDPSKLIKAIWEISTLEKLPPRVPLGLDSVAIFQSKIDQLKDDVEKTSHWSKDLRFD